LNSSWLLCVAGSLVKWVGVGFIVLECVYAYPYFCLYLRNFVGQDLNSWLCTCKAHAQNFFLWYWDLNWGPCTLHLLYCLSHTSSPFCSGYFGDGVLRTICLGWLQTLILLISASQLARIIDVNHGAWFI
jgi:hypothetical protein